MRVKTFLIVAILLYVEAVVKVAMENVMKKLIAKGPPVVGLGHGVAYFAYARVTKSESSWNELTDLLSQTQK